METKIQIKTPKGKAKTMEKYLRPVILGANVFKRFRKQHHDIYVNDDDDTIVWDIEAPIRRILKIQKNVSYFDVLVKTAMTHKKVKKHLNPDQHDELEDLLKNHTKIEIIKNATAEELVELNKTWWQRVKETFTNIS